MLKLFLFFFIVLFFTSGCVTNFFNDSDDGVPIPEPPPNIPKPTPITEVETSENNNNNNGVIISEHSLLKIGNFNAKDFGNLKWNRYRDFYIDLVQDYDILFLQEIREKSGESFRELCSVLESSYNCVISSRAGTTSRKEQYGVLYKNNIEVVEFNDYNPQYNGVWERPPIQVKFKVNDYEFTAWNIHIDPDLVHSEMIKLEEIVEDSGNVIILGDLNLDCRYDDGSNGNFETWNYIINDNEDTTTSEGTHCAYDRIILNNDMNQEYSTDGIDTSITTQSDHYPIWIEIKT